MPIALDVHWFNQSRPLVRRPIQWVWNGYLARNAVTVFTSRWKSGKTTLLSVLLAKMGTGGELAGATVSASRVIYASEESDILWQQRDEYLHFGEHFGLIARPRLGQATSESWLEMLGYIADQHRQQPCDLAVIDTLSTFLPPHAETHATPMMAAMAPIRALADSGLSVLLVHHPRKTSVGLALEPRGSGALSGFADILIEQDCLPNAKSDDRRRSLRARSRFADSPQDQLIEWTASGTDYTLCDVEALEFDAGWPILKSILEDAQFKLTRKRIHHDWPADHARPNVVTLWRWLDRAVAAGRVVRQGAGRNRDPYLYWLPGHESHLWPDIPPLPLLRNLNANVDKYLCDEERRAVAKLERLEMDIRAKARKG